MYEKWPNALELPLGQEEGSREAQSRERSERVGRSAVEDNTAGAGALFSQRECAGCREARAGVFNAVLCCTKRLLSAVSVA